MNSKYLSKLAMALATALLALAAFGSVAQAATPAPGYTQFTGCPTKAEVPTVVACIHSVVKGGHFQMGNKDVPLSNPMTLTAGWDPETTNLYANAQGGLSKTKQKVPGGVIGLTGLTWLLEILGSEALTLYAVTEIAGQPKLFGIETLTLPVKVHLINSVLGNNCYVGSTTNPIVLKLTTGTTSPPLPNKPISGIEPEASFDESGIITAKNSEFVDNAFAAPGASGCVLTLFGFIPISINGLVNTQSGLPAAAGTNETRQQIDSELVDVNLVYP